MVFSGAVNRQPDLSPSIPCTISPSLISLRTLTDLAKALRLSLQKLTQPFVVFFIHDEIPVSPSPNPWLGPSVFPWFLIYLPKNWSRYNCSSPSTYLYVEIPWLLFILCLPALHQVPEERGSWVPAPPNGPPGASRPSHQWRQALDLFSFGGFKMFCSSLPSISM